MVQLINTAFAVYEMHQQSGRTREAQRIRAVVEQQLAPFTGAVANIVEQSTRDGVLTDTSGTLTAAFEFTAKTVADVEVPIAEMVLLPSSATPADIRRAVASHGFSRYIPTDEDGNPSGYLHLKDVMDLTTPEKFSDPVPAKRIRRLAPAFSGSDLEDALATMRRTGATSPGSSTPMAQQRVCCSSRTLLRNLWARCRMPPAHKLARPSEVPNRTGRSGRTLHGS